LTHANRTFNLKRRFVILKKIRCFNLIKSGVQVSIDTRPALKRGKDPP